MQRKEKILFMTLGLQSGGAEKSLVSLLSCLDYKKYEVDLMLVDKSGLFFDLLPKEVTVKSAPKFMQQLMKKKELSTILSGDKAILAFFVRSVVAAFLKITNIFYRINDKNSCQFIWRIWKWFLPTTHSNYKYVVSYLQGFPMYFTLDKIKGGKRIGWIHTDYIESGLYSKLDKKYITQLDYVVTVSKTCKESLIKSFENISDRTIVIENIISKESIIRLSNYAPNVLLDQDTFNIISVGRLSVEKGYETAIKVCAKLVKRYGNIKWYIVGKGPERSHLEALIEELHLSKNFILLGENANPYSIIKQADIYVQPSIYEGKAIAVEEAKALEKPIIVTNYPTVTDQISHGYTGLIAEKTVESIYDSVVRLLNEDELRKALSNNLKGEIITNTDEIRRLEAIFDEK